MKHHYPILLVVLLLFVAGCLKEVKDQFIPKPFANFSFSNDGCTAPCTIQFTNSSQNTDAYSWDFGDGGVSTDPNPSKTYPQKGQYNVRLRATGPGGADDTTMVITIKGQGPKAAFEVINDNCVAPCTTSFTNTSQNATTYEWSFGNGNTSTQFSPNNLYNTKGQYTVKLKAFNTDGVDSISKTVTIKSGNFRSVLDVSTINATPLHVVERSDGRYHVLYFDNEYRSILVEKGGTSNISGTKVTFSALSHIDNPIALPTSDGGFAIAGNNSGGTEIQYAKISSSRSATPAFSKSSKFRSNALVSQIFGLILNNNGDLCITGRAVSADLSNIGLIIATNSTGTPSAQAWNPSNNTFIDGVHLVQNSNGSYTILATDLSLGGSPKEYLVSFNGTSSFSLSRTLDFDVYSSSKILRSGNRYFIVNLDRSPSSVIEINSSGVFVAKKDFSQNLKDAIIDKNGDLVVTGLVSSTKFYLAKVNSLTGSPIWEKTYTDPAASIFGEFISLAADGGYLILGKYTLNGVTDLLLIKTDVNGNIE